MNSIKHRELFIRYMNEVNDTEPKYRRRTFTTGTIKQWIAITILACISLMTIWELIKEVAMKLRF